MQNMEFVVPDLDRLPAYTDALKRGWSPDNVRLAEAAREQLAEIDTDPAAFVASLDGRDPKGFLVTFPDGSKKPRLPGYRLWMWDGEFCGSIGFRWQPGTSALPPYVLGHIGYAVVPWKRRLGYATRALALMLDEARREALSYVELTTDPANEVSQKVITRNGGTFVERFRADPAYGDKDELRFRIML